MGTLTFNIPDELAKDYDNTVRFIAVKLYEADKIRMGQAAEMCGMKKWDFAGVLLEYGIHVMDAAALDDVEQFKRDQNKI